MTNAALALTRLLAKQAHPRSIPEVQPLLRFFKTQITRLFTGKPMILESEHARLTIQPIQGIRATLEVDRKKFSLTAEDIERALALMFEPYLEKLYDQLTKGGDAERRPALPGNALSTETIHDVIDTMLTSRMSGSGSPGGPKGELLRHVGVLFAEHAEQGVTMEQLTDLLAEKSHSDDPRRYASIMVNRINTACANLGADACIKSHIVYRFERNPRKKPQ